MKCRQCECELTKDMCLAGMCFNCGYSVQETEQYYEAESKKRNQQLQAEKAEQQRLEIEQQKLQIEKYNIECENLIKMHKLTTGFNFEGYTITDYLGLVSGEKVFGTGYFSDISASISDVFGVEDSNYSNTLKSAKKKALADMIKESAKLGGNAVIGVSYECLTFSKNMIGVSANGTSVKIRETD